MLQSKTPRLLPIYMYADEDCLHSPQHYTPAINVFNVIMEFYFCHYTYIYCNVMSAPGVSSDIAILFPGRQKRKDNVTGVRHLGNRAEHWSCLGDAARRNATAFITLHNTASQVEGSCGEAMHRHSLSQSRAFCLT